MRVDEFETGVLIGRGQNGEVFEARKLGSRPRMTGLRYPFALKRLQKPHCLNARFIKNFHNELKILRSLNHPGICAVEAFGGFDSGKPYFVTQRARGATLRQILAKRGVLSPAEATWITARLANILRHVHESGFVHRDIKPEHIIIAQKESAQNSMDMYLIDFGVACGTNPDERTEERGKFFGTPSYASPEQALGRVDIDARADVFSLGTVLFEMLTGRLPFWGTRSRNVLERVAYEDAPRVGPIQPAVPRPLQAIVAYAHAKNRHDRLPSASILLELLREYALDADWNRAEKMLFSTIETARNVPTTPRISHFERISSCDTAVAA